MVCDDLLEAFEVNIHVFRTGVLAFIQLPADGKEKLAERLNVFLFRTIHVGDELLDALVHNLLLEHLDTVELSNEAHKTETSSLGLLCSVVLV